jgi:hypothetical protein
MALPFVKCAIAKLHRRPIGEAALELDADRARVLNLEAFPLPSFLFRPRNS